MLLFIDKKTEKVFHAAVFQYISCYSLSRNPNKKRMVGRSVSIHLMLLFIGVLIGGAFAIGERFNTSHVTLYQRASDFVDTMTLFQYISCYSLSDFRVIIDILVASFNTSHVTLYRLLLFQGGVNMVFQYISCYSLSLLFG